MPVQSPMPTLGQLQAEVAGLRSDLARVTAERDAAVVDRDALKEHLIRVNTQIQARHNGERESDRLVALATDFFAAFSKRVSKR